MKKHLAPLLGVALVAALIATGIFYGFLVTRLQASSESAPSSQVVVAAKALDRGSVLTAEDLATSQHSGPKAPAASFNTADQVVGLTLLEPLSANDALTAPRVSPRGAAGGASLAIPSGMRAVSIHPNDSFGVVALLRSGSRVDIQVLDNRGGREGILLHRLLENVEVLSKSGVENGGRRPDVTLLVSPKDADRLSLADAAMQIRLVLRNPGDHAAGESATITPAAVAGSAMSAPLARR
jgi:Flp pilus assembly protein CpaB